MESMYFFVFERGVLMLNLIKQNKVPILSILSLIFLIALFGIIKTALYLVIIAGILAVGGGFIYILRRGFKRHL